MATKAQSLAEKLGMSLDELSVMALEELLRKYSRSSQADFDFEEKMAIAHRGIQKYQQTIVELGQ